MRMAWELRQHIEARFEPGAFRLPHAVEQSAGLRNITLFDQGFRQVRRVQTALSDSGGVVPAERIAEQFDGRGWAIQFHHASPAHNVDLILVEPVCPCGGWLPGVGEHVVYLVEDT